MQPRRIHVFMIEDHPAYIAGTESGLAPQFELVGSATTGHEALHKAGEFEIDVLLVDLKLPDADGLDIAKRLQRLRPSMKILVITGYDDDRSLLGVLRAGVNGYLLKPKAHGPYLNQALEAITLGKLFFGDPGEDAPVALLSPREREILRLVAKGLPNQEIATKLNLSVRTVEKHRENIGDKIGVSGELELTRYSIRNGIFAPRVAAAVPEP